MKLKLFVKQGKSCLTRMEIKSLFVEGMPVGVSSTNECKPQWGNKQNFNCMTMSLRKTKVSA